MTVMPAGREGGKISYAGAAVICYDFYIHGGVLAKTSRDLWQPLNEKWFSFPRNEEKMQ
jgi:hypothetical protein